MNRLHGRNAASPAPTSPGLWKRQRPGYRCLPPWRAATRSLERAALGSACDPHRQVRSIVLSRICATTADQPMRIGTNSQHRSPHAAKACVPEQDGAKRPCSTPLRRAGLLRYRSSVGGVTRFIPVEVLADPLLAHPGSEHRWPLGLLGRRSPRSLQPVCGTASDSGTTSGGRPTCTPMACDHRSAAKRPYGEPTVPTMARARLMHSALARVSRVGMLAGAR